MPTRDDQEAPEDELAAAIGATVERWRLPQASSLQPWQARIVGAQPRPRPPWGWLRPLRRASGLAVALVVVVALGVALVATRPGQPAGVGGVASPTAAPTPAASTFGTPSSPPSVAPSPRAQAFGAPIAPRTLLLTGAQSRLLSLPGGALSTPLVSFDQNAFGTVFARSDGTYLCACGTQSSQGEETTIQMTAQLYDTKGTLLRSFAAGAYGGGASGSADVQSAAATSATLTPDGRTLLIGYAERGTSGWQRGLAVYDVATGARTQQVSLGSVPLQGPGPSPAPDAYAWAPVVTVSPDARHVVISAEVVAGNEVVSQRWWSAPLAGGRVGALTSFPTGPQSLSGAACTGFGNGAGGTGGFASNSIFVQECGNGLTSVLHRVNLVGQPLGDVTLPADFGMTGPPGLALDPRTATYYGWDPFSGRLVRVDAAVGRVTGSVLLPKTTADAGGPLAQLGRRLGGWLVPQTYAKTYLQPSIALSPDGSRLYLVGTTGTSFTSVAGSSGVLVLDARSLQVLGHWAPAADYDSIAVSRDGSLVYVLGMPGANNASQQASLTVYDAASGAVRLSLNNLGADFVQFTDTLEP